jgi:hypothetical protein
MPLQEESDTPSAIQNSLTEDIDSLVTAHPLLDLVIEYGFPNARSEVLQRYLRLLLHDDLFQQNKCPRCFDANMKPTYYFWDQDETAVARRLPVHDPSSSASSQEEVPLSLEIPIYNGQVCRIFFCPFCLIEGPTWAARNLYVTIIAPAHHLG